MCQFLQRQCKAIMSELNHYFGGDISVNNTGDLLSISGTTRSQQRLLRRLLTNPGAYIFHSDYGAGLPAKVGDTLDIPKLRALIRGQVQLEDSIAKTPEAVISLSAIANGVTVNIKYTDVVTSNVATLSFNVNR